MKAPKTSEVDLDFVLYLGDPDEGAQHIPSAQALETFDDCREQLAFDDAVYGALSLKRDGAEIDQLRPDPIIKLLTTLVRTLSYVIEGEPETALLTESEHGFLFEPSNDKVMISVFRGYDAYDPEEYLVESVSMTMDDFGGQLVGMAERLVEILKKFDAERFKSDELGKDLLEFLEVSRDALRAYRLEIERGLRH